MLYRFLLKVYCLSSVVSLAQNPCGAPLDQFDPKSTFRFGPNIGQCIDTTKRRSIHMLDATQAKVFNLSSGEKVFANFSHQGKFWIAKVDQEAVEQVIFQLHRFDGIGHGQLRIKMNPHKPIILYPQILQNNPIEAYRLNDFIISTEVVGLPGKSFNPVQGIKGHFAAAHRFVSLEDKFKSSVGVGDEVEQFMLELTPAQKRKLLRDALAKSHKAGLTEKYNTLTHSCMTRTFDLLDGVDLNRTWFDRVLTKIKRVPNLSKVYLHWRGLFGADSVDNVLPSLKAECGNIFGLQTPS